VFDNVVVVVVVVAFKFVKSLPSLGRVELPVALSKLPHRPTWSREVYKAGTVAKVL
jgi:hypothetical protein